MKDRPNKTAMNLVPHLPSQCWMPLSNRDERPLELTVKFDEFNLHGYQRFA